MFVSARLFALVTTALVLSGVGGPRPLCGPLRLEAVSRTAEVPAGTVLEVRLAHLVGSYGAKVGQSVNAVLVAPVGRGREIWLPEGTEVAGRVTYVRRIGLGIRREVARLELTFDRLRLPGGEELPISTRLLDVDNAREEIDAGRIVGIRATGSLGRRVSGLVVGVVALRDILLMGFALSGSLAVMQFPESEIILPAGTELKLGLTRAIRVNELFSDRIAPVAADDDERASLAGYVARLPFRTHTRGNGIPSDLTNLLIVGSASALSRAFEAAGWSPSDELTASSSYRAFVALAGNRGYSEAPMSELVLDRKLAAFTFQKGFNTFAKRHHLRVFAVDETWRGEPAWTASATQDIGIAFSKEKKTFIHVIDREIDHERSKVVNDLIFSGCVDAADIVDRPHVPRDARNATGEPLVTDGRIAVLRLNDCARSTVAEPAAPVPSMPAIGNPLQRGFRHFFLAAKNDLWRGNMLYQAYEGVRFVGRYVFGRDRSPVTPSVMVIDGIEYRLGNETPWGYAPSAASFASKEKP